MARRVHMVRGLGGSLRVSDWGEGEVSLGRGNILWGQAFVSIKGLRRLIAILQRIESQYQEPL